MALVDQYGKAIDTGILTEELAAPELTGIRQAWDATVITSGLTPERLVAILQNAAINDAYEYLTLAEEMEERDLHYAAQLGTRKRAVTGLEISVEAATDSREDVRLADSVRDLLSDDAIADDQADMLDALGKGWSVLEILWDRSGREWRPGFEWRDPRHFLFDRVRGRELRLRTVDDPDGMVLPPYKFVTHIPRLKSGLPIRGGLARLAMIAYMCKAWAWKDWHSFADIFGMPLRVGRYGPGASPDDKAALRRAVNQIAADAAALIPESMKIEFITATAGSGGTDLYRELCNWWDKQISKGVLGQTMTADDGASLSQAQVHNDVRMDILEADCRQLQGTLNRDIVRPFVDLNFGPQQRYPRIRIPVPEPDRTETLVKALAALVPLGLRVEQSVVRDKLSIPDPDDGAEVLQHNPASPAIYPAVNRALNREQPPPAQQQAEQLARIAAPVASQAVAKIEELLAEVSTLDEFRDRLFDLYPDLPTGELASVMGEAMTAAALAGRYDLLEGDT